VKVNEFTSDRKMMSIVVDGPEGRVNYGKGADVAIISKLANVYNEDKEMITRLNSWASEGLRTLMFCMKQGEDESAYDLIGITGVEDLLQDNVKQTIGEFIAAGLKVWMLTGDKGATARNIGLTCGIFEEAMHVHNLEAEQDTLSQL
jgi:phospholipid-transporting ATPase